MEYYYINKSNERKGPISEVDFGKYDIQPTTYVWCKGMDTWKQVKDVPSLSSIIQQTNDEQQKNTTPKKCNKCGAIINEQDKFCPNCGTTIKYSSNKNGHTILLISCIVTFIIAILCVLWLLFFNKDNSPLSEREQPDIAIHEDSVENSESMNDNYACTIEINGKDLRLRLSPSINGETLKFLDGHNIHPHKGDRLQYISETSDWYNVYYKGHSVYVSKEYSSKSSYDEYIQEPTLVVITGNNTFMRLSDDEGGTIARNSYGQIIYLKKWNTYTYVYESEYYYAIKYSNQTVYVSKYESHSI